MNLREDLPTLVVGDIHHRTGLAEAIIAKHAPRCAQVIFLGDYFDDFGDNPDTMRQTCHWLAESLRQPNRLHLLGNHDVAYFLPQHRQTKCPGWTPAKQKVFEPERPGLPIGSFKLAVCLGPWLLTHAGIPEGRAKGLDAVALARQIEGDFAKAQAGAGSWIFDVGAARGGSSSGSGILWLDWAREFRPIAGLNQIVGHTPALGVARAKCLMSDGTHRQFELTEPSPFPRMTKLPQPGGEWSSVNWCLDTGQVFSAIIDRGELELVT